MTGDLHTVAVALTLAVAGTAVRAAVLASRSGSRRARERRGLDDRDDRNDRDG